MVESEANVFRSTYENVEADMPNFNKYIVVAHSEESWIQALQIALNYAKNTPYLLRELKDMGVIIGNND